MRVPIPKRGRLQVYERDGSRCVRCGTADELVIHHVLPVSEGGRNEVDNLLLVCVTCHKTIHLERGDWYAYRMAGTVAEFTNPAEPVGWLYQIDVTGLSDSEAKVVIRLVMAKERGESLTTERIAEDLDVSADVVAGAVKGLYKKRKVALVSRGEHPDHIWLGDVDYTVEVTKRAS